MPTVEQIVKAAIYKEMRNLTYRKLEYAQHDSRLCAKLHILFMSNRAQDTENMSGPRVAFHGLESEKK